MSHFLMSNQSDELPAPTLATHHGSAAKVIEAKVKLLKCIKTIRLNPNQCFLGQFGPSKYKVTLNPPPFRPASPSLGPEWQVGQKEFSEPGYLDDETVPKDSRCPTFASLLLQVDNTRWRGVPFLMTAGKGLDERLCEVAAPPMNPAALQHAPSPPYTL